MRYILDSSGYIDSVSCTPFNCKDKNCIEYKGSIPSGYNSIEDWAINANIRAYKISGSNLVFDSAKDAALQAEWAQLDGYGAVVGKASKNLVNVNDRTITYSQQVGELITKDLSNITVSFNYNNTGSVNGVCRIQDINGNNIKSIVANANSSNFVSTNLDVSNYDYVKFVFQGTGSGYNYSFSNFQVEQGSTATEYEEYYPPVIAAVDSNGGIHEVGNNYSSNEHIIGTWIDGKIIYRRVIDLGSIPSNASRTYDIGLNLTNCFPIKWTMLGRFSWGMVKQYTEGRDLITSFRNDGFFLESFADFSSALGILIVEYTKN